jgi:hypothetical protein
VGSVNVCMSNLSDTWPVKYQLGLTFLMLVLIPEVQYIFSICITIYFAYGYSVSLDARLLQSNILSMQRLSTLRIHYLNTRVYFVNIRDLENVSKQEM